MKLATWNVNSIRIRESQVLRWIGRVEPDILLLQEIKCEEQAFPTARFSELGYQTVVVGQKAYNGVAVLSRIPFTVRHRGLPGLPPEDTQARYLEIETQGIHICNLYVPNGNSGGEAGFAYKLRWLELLARHAQVLLEADLPIILAGDFNIRSEERRVGKECRSRCDWSSDVCSSDLSGFCLQTPMVGAFGTARAGFVRSRSSHHPCRRFQHKIGRASCRERV